MTSGRVPPLAAVCDHVGSSPDSGHIWQVTGETTSNGSGHWVYALMCAQQGLTGAQASDGHIVDGGTQTASATALAWSGCSGHIGCHSRQSQWSASLTHHSWSCTPSSWRSAGNCEPCHELVLYQANVTFAAMSQCLFGQDPVTAGQWDCRVRG